MREYRTVAEAYSELNQVIENNSLKGNDVYARTIYFLEKYEFTPENLTELNNIVQVEMEKLNNEQDRLENISRAIKRKLPLS